MGEVWLARTTQTDVPRLCALKLLRDDVTSDREAIARFADEVRIGILLQHKNIASVLDFGRVGDRHYLAMDFIDGIDLRSIVQAQVARQVVVPRPVALAIADDLLHGLAAAHAAVDPTTGALLHVVHRDVSPHNVLLGVDGIARVIDFGLALSTLKREKTERDVVLGKIAYMAPEQAAGQRAAPAADVYAAALVICEVLLGERFYGALSGVELYRTVVAGSFVSPGLGALGALGAVLRRALSSSPAARPTAAALAAELREAAPRASSTDVAAWMVSTWPEAAACAAARVARSTEIDDRTETLRMPVSLIPDDVVATAGASATIYSAPGVWGEARVPAPGVVHVVLRGHGDEAAGAWQRRMVDDELARHTGPVQFFSDVEQLTTHDAIFRQQMTAWQARVRERVSQMVLFRSQLVVVAITIANALSGGGTEVTSSRARFEAELAAAVTARNAGRSGQ